MPENIWFIAAIWMGLAFIASLISIRIGISVVLVEILVGVAPSNFSAFTRRPSGSISSRWSAAAS
jgi:Kef-type K+ transport system membrane component KefB